MENDSIRASGMSTLVDIWIDGELRAITVSQEAIEAFLGFDQVAAMSDADRCEFVRTHLPLVVAAAKARLRDSDPAAIAVVIDAGQLPRLEGSSEDRRQIDRRKGERRKSSQPRGDQPERRRGDRRKGGPRPTGPKGA